VGVRSLESKKTRKNETDEMIPGRNSEMGSRKGLTGAELPGALHWVETIGEMQALLALTKTLMLRHLNVGVPCI
jgi:ribosomal protein L19E